MNSKIIQIKDRMYDAMLIIYRSSRYTPEQQSILIREVFINTVNEINIILEELRQERKEDEYSSSKVN